MFLRKKPRRDIIVLNVVALIDICSILIIFLIKGAYFGQTSIEAPAELVFPASINSDDVLQAPQVLVYNHRVKSNVVSGEFDVSLFKSEILTVEMEKYKNQLIQFVKNMPADLKTSGVYLNIIADKKTNYSEVFDVLQFYRSAGFESVLFVAEGDQ